MTRSAALFGAALLVAAALAAALRLPNLGLRVPHSDEANQFVKTSVLLESGAYRYDPTDHHGPTLYYAALPVLWAAGVETGLEADLWHYRLVTALAGVACLLVVAGLADGLGRAGAALAAGFLAVSPAMVYYSRYYIQETLLVLFTLAAAAALWRYVRSRRAGWLVACGVAVGLMHATKETWVLTAASAAAALVVVVWLERWQADESASLRSWLRPGAVIAAVVAAAAVTVVFFSSFFTHAAGPIDSVRTYLYYLTRSEGAGLHANPWWFYLRRLLWFHDGPGPSWTEAAIVGLACIGVAAGWVGRGLGKAHAGLVRAIALATGLLIVAYALVPYKTTWCLLSFLAGLCLLAGVGAAALVRWMPRPTLKVAMAGLLLAAGAHLARQAVAASHDPRWVADPRNPYVYAHTAMDVRRLAERMEALAAASPAGYDTVVKVVVPTNYWPLPWHLRWFRHVGFYDAVPADPSAPIVVASHDVVDAMAARLGGDYQPGLYRLRPGVFLTLFVERDLWNRFMADRQGPGEAAP